MWTQNIHLIKHSSLALAMVTILGSFSVAYAQSKYEDDGKAIQAELLCETVNVSNITDWPVTHPDEAFRQDNFSFVVKVKDNQIKIFGGDYNIHKDVARNLGWMPITSKISYQTWEASGNWGRYVNALEGNIYFAKLDVFSSSVFSFVAKCQQM